MGTFLKVLTYGYPMGPHIGKLSESSKVTELASDKRWMNHTHQCEGELLVLYYPIYRITLLDYHGQNSHFELQFQ